MKIILILLFSFFVIGVTSCKNYRLKRKYDALHEKYRTLWYRTDKECFYDSARKYGLLYDSLMGFDNKKVFDIDTTPVNEPAICQ